MDFIDDEFVENNYNDSGNTVDFSEFEDEAEEEYINYDYNQTIKQPQSKYKFYGKSIEFDEKTQEYYRILREQKICPLSKNIFEGKENFAFKFDDQWFGIYYPKNHQSK